MARKWRTLITVGCLITLILVMVANTYVGHGFGYCNRCFARNRWSKVRIVGIPFRNQFEVRQQGPPALQMIQATCPHDWYAIHSESGYLLQATELGCGRAPSGMSIVQAMEQPGDLKPALEAFVNMAERVSQEAQDKWVSRSLDSPAWAMQLLAGRDFGVVYDMNEHGPMLRGDSIGRILDLAAQEGVLEPGNRQRLRAIGSQPGEENRR